jgi:bifunctional UDP-N-acetylglucosamine pyrophosphorylase/glucosamine-1-phosphate N-acetyltransferase
MLVSIAPDHAHDTLLPLSTTMRLADARFGPLTFSQLREHILRKSGCQLTLSGSGLNVLHIGADSWLSSTALAVCEEIGVETLLNDSEGHHVGFKTDGDAPAAKGPTVELQDACRIRYPWHLLKIARLVAADLELEDLPADGDLCEGSMIDGQLWCGRGTKILPGVYVEGTVVIGANCKIGPNCYLRGPIFIGDNCRIGQAVEIKASVIMDDTNVGHLSYVGDSVLGNRANLGAGTITANLRHDGANVRSELGGQLIDTARRKLGTIIGDGVHTGINTSIYPGRKLGAGASTRPGEIIDRDRLSPQS